LDFFYLVVSNSSAVATIEDTVVFKKAPKMVENKLRYSARYDNIYNTLSTKIATRSQQSVTIPSHRDQQALTYLPWFSFYLPLKHNK